MDEHPRTEVDALPWAPLPPEANRFMLVNVASFEYVGPLRTGGPVAVTVSSDLPWPGNEKPVPLIWRIVFGFAQAFRRSPMEFWDGVCPWNAEDPPGTRVATWEVRASLWLNTDLAYRIGRLPERLRPRHFVIASSYDVYEIAAVTWRCDFLGPGTEFWKGLEKHWGEELGVRRDGTLS